MLKSNSVKFNKDGKLVIMQVSDPQDLVYVRKAMVKMLDKAYDKIKPDLILFTGDNILGNHLLDARFGTRKIGSGWDKTFDQMEKSLKHILDPVEKRNIPFGMIFGNHDDMNCVTKEEQLTIFRNYGNCLPMNTTDSSRDGATYNIPILSSDGKKTIFNLWMMDSAWYDKEADKCYCRIKPEATKWFTETNNILKKENGDKYIPSLMFMHVPLPQQIGLCKECSKSDPGAIPTKDGKFICLDKAKATGVMGEPPSICDEDSGLFDEIKNAGNVMAVVGGHDHLNSFDGSVDGVRFIQTACASFRCYGSNIRGVRLFILDENKPDSFETKEIHYEDVCGNSIGAKVRYFMDADELTKYKIGVIAGTVISSAGLIAATISKAKKN